MRDQLLYIDGRWLEGVGRLPVRNPYDDEVTGTFAQATPDQVTTAATAAAPLRRMVSASIRSSRWLDSTGEPTGWSNLSTARTTAVSSTVTRSSFVFVVIDESSDSSCQKGTV
jgi:hypothetical protein